MTVGGGDCDGNGDDHVLFDIAAILPACKILSRFYGKISKFYVADPPHPIRHHAIVFEPYFSLSIFLLLVKN